ncbi:MAG: DNA primase [Planctomycetes bacterium]|nr:DNA primase [Planctomycetota bacterium]
MAKLPEHFIHQVQQATDIVELVGRYVTLRRRGKDHVGLCPFHQEKTPSFAVSPTKQMFKCFGCGAGGGVFQFVMLQQKITFPEAVRLLAEQAGIPVPADDGPPAEAGMDRGELVRLMRFAADFYRQQLRQDAGAAALAYVRGRGVTDESIERFELGAAPDAWDALYRAARAAGFRDRQLAAVGLVAERDGGGYYDRFRNRLMFPIIDAAGRVIAFGGRALSDDQRAKYLNSPETVLFDKSSNLYGLAWARQPIARTGRVVVVEGYFDALMPAQAGMDNVVATLGTALTERHVRMLSRLAPDVTLVFDSDAAGAAAAERGLELFIAQEMHVRIGAVPDGKDPCDYVLSAGVEAFARVVEQAPDALDYVWRKRSAQFAGAENLVERRQAAEDFLRIVVTSAAYGAIDAVRQGMLVNQLAHLMGLPVEHLTQQVRRLLRRVPTASAPASPPSATDRGVVMGPAGAQRRILEVLVAEPDLFDQAARQAGPEEFTDPVLAAVAREIWRLGDLGELNLESLLSVAGGDDWGRIVTDLATAAERRGNHAATLAEDLAYLESCRCRRRLDELRQAASSGDEESLRRYAAGRQTPDVRRMPR